MPRPGAAFWLDGAVTAIFWEIAEYYTFIGDSPEVHTAYTDTLGDLVLGLSGSTIAAVLAATILWPGSKNRARPA